MNEAISQLNRNTALKTSGQTPDSSAMNEFGYVILKYLDRRSIESQYNLIENVLCFEGLLEELQKTYEERKQDLSKKLSLDNLSKQENSFEQTEEMGAMKR